MRHAYYFAEWQLRERGRLKAYQNRHAGMDCFLIGNGPSLNRMDLAPLRDYYTFGLNKIYLLREHMDFTPTYLVATNPLVIEQSVEAFLGLGCPVFVTQERGREILPPADNVHYLRTTWNEGVLAGFQENIQGRLIAGATVTFTAMQLAYCMGFRNVYLIGVDHNYPRSGAANERQRFTGEDINHFHPDYFKGKDWHCPDLEASELAYHCAQFFFRRGGGAIYDATVEGKLDIYPKIPYDEALARCRKRQASN